jgi:hypothetical protein
MGGDAPLRRELGRPNRAFCQGKKLFFDKCRFSLSNFHQQDRHMGKSTSSIGCEALREMDG